jgi:hypothetical protein
MDGEDSVVVVVTDRSSDKGGDLGKELSRREYE